MVFGCAANTVKCLVFFFNFLAFLAGAILLGVGIAGLVSGAVYNKISEYATSESIAYTSIKAALYVAIAVGAIIMILGFLGCCGALCESQCLLGLFITVMTIMIVIQVAAGIVAFVYKDKVKDAVTSGLQDASTKIDTDSGACELWQDVQKNLPCCGMDGNPWHLVPGAKCNVTCPANGLLKKCPDELYNLLQKSAQVLGIIALCVVVLELAALIFSCCLCCSVKGER